VKYKITTILVILTVVERDPRRKTSNILIFFDRVSCSFHLRGTGESERIKSVTTSVMA
jgi:hypothetical protein